jgi:hypothetical protein
MHERISAIPVKALFILASVTYLEVIDVSLKVISTLIAVVVGVYAVINYIQKTRVLKTEHKLKLRELEKADQEWWEDFERKQKLKESKP